MAGFNVRFQAHWGSYYPGCSASFVKSEAMHLVSVGVAVLVDEPARAPDGAAAAEPSGIDLDKEPTENEKAPPDQPVPELEPKARKAPARKKKAAPKG